MNKKFLILLLKITITFLVYFSWIILYSNFIKTHMEWLFLFLLSYNLLWIITLWFMNIRYALFYGGVLLITVLFIIFSLSASLFSQTCIQQYIIAFLIQALLYFILISYYYIKLLEEAKTEKFLLESLQEEYHLLNRESIDSEEKNKSLKIELERMNKLSHAAFILGTTMDENELANHLMNEIKNILSIDKAFLSKYNKIEKKYLIFSQIGYPTESINQATDNIDDWIQETKLPILINNINTETKIKTKRYSPFLTGSSLIVAPIIVTGQVYGILRCENEGINYFSNDELRVLDYISDLASITFETLFYYKEVERLAITDGITGLYVHKYMIEKFENEIGRFYQNKTPLSLIMFDIDNFKYFNDTFGHQFGDAILIAVSKVIQNTIREIDFPVRYGGDEFSIILPQTEIEGAITLAERLFERVKTIDLNLLIPEIKVSEKLTISMGLGTFKKSYENYTTFIDKVDSYLYKAKNSGKNKIELVK